MPSSLRGLPADVCANVLETSDGGRLSADSCLIESQESEIRSMDLVNGLGQWIRSKIGVRPSAFRRGVGLEQGHSSKINGGDH